jgi:16S rRNA (uracil1498-N3)-methyltransferase
MSRRRFYVPKDSIRNGIAILPADQAYHLRNVLRIGTGEIVEIFDGAGNGYTGNVELQGSEVFIRGLQSLPPEESRIRLILAAALIKSAKFEWILQKATELGVHEIIPLNTRLSDIRIPGDTLTFRLERWDRLVREASKQCRRLAAPRVHAPRTFSDLLKTEELSACTRLLFYEKAREQWHPEPGMFSDRVVLCVGPEGGWEGSEIKQAKEAGYKIFSLGPWVLRAETAALAAISIVQHQIFLFEEFQR